MNSLKMTLFVLQSNLMHEFENVLMLAAYFETDLLADARTFVDELLQGDVALADIYKHDHIKEAIEDRLADVQHVDVVLEEHGGDVGDDALFVITGDGDDGFLLWGCHDYFCSPCFFSW